MVKMKRKAHLSDVSQGFTLPRGLHAAIHKDAAARYQTFTQWIRDAAVSQLKRRGALPKK